MYTVSACARVSVCGICWESILGGVHCAYSVSDGSVHWFVYIYLCVCVCVCAVMCECLCSLFAAM